MALTANKIFIASWDVNISAVADHYLVEVTLKLKDTKPQPSYIFTRSYKNYNPESFLSDLECDPLHIVNMFDDFDDQVGVFNKLFLDTLSEHASIKRSKIKSRPNPFITPEKIINHCLRNREPPLTTVEDPVVQANRFNDFYVSVGEAELLNPGLYANSMASRKSKSGEWSQLQTISKMWITLSFMLWRNRTLKGLSSLFHQTKRLGMIEYPLECLKTVYRTLCLSLLILLNKWNIPPNKKTTLLLTYMKTLTSKAARATQV